MTTAASRCRRRIAAGGDRIHRVEGVLSGSLAWLFNRYDGTRPFSRFVREARDAGLSLCAEEVRVESLVPVELAALPVVIQCPGAGAEVTAAVLLDDVLRIA